MNSLTAENAAHLRSTLETISKTCDQVPGTEDPEDAERLATAAESAEQSIRSMRSRLTGVCGLIAGEQECDEPPDEAGLCLRCGLRIAPRMEPHNPGCFGGRLAVAIGRPVVRGARFVRLVRRGLQR